MIDATRLKDELKLQVTALEADLRKRLKDKPAFAEPLKDRYQTAFQSKRTAATFNTWAEHEITQAAVAWVLATVFIRFLEDNGFIPDPILSGPPERLRLAQDALSHYFLQHPGHAERDYLLHHFATLRQYPALTELLGPHNALHGLYPSSYALKGLIAFWRQIDPTSGDIRHDFRGAELNTRFLGDLYQDLSKAARKTYALLQTPDFIEAFILDRTLTPALCEFGLETVRMIDPTCGSGHFLLGAFRRLFALWVQKVPTTREAAVKALAAVHGVDLNPFAVAISRFRLIIEACHACGITRLADAPDFEIHVATGDSLLHGRRFRDFDGGEGVQPTLPGSEDPAFRDELRHHYEVEDAEALHRILGKPYHAVVGNPPYITVKDKALSELYRARYPSCRGKYSLSVPFLERFFDLALKGDGTPHQPAGFVGQITANSFMKREFGKKLIEEYLPRWDLTHVLDTSGAYIPGHGTPTVILFGKNRPPVSETIRTVLGIRGEPATPEDPTQGLVWKAICGQVDKPGSVSEWVSTADTPRTNFGKHPWSIGGGGAAELKEQIDDVVEENLDKHVKNIGICAVTLEDDAFTAPSGTFVRHNIDRALVIPFVEGDAIRHWQTNSGSEALFPYEPTTLKPTSTARFLSFLWPLRSTLRKRSWFRKTQDERGLHWFEYGFLSKDQFRASSAIAFAFVATHNNFAIQDKLSVFNRSSPTIRLRDSSFTSVQMIGVLNGALGCFWMKQIFFPKGGDQVGKEGARIRKTLWDERYEHDTAKLTAFPIPPQLPTQLPTLLVQTSTTLQGHTPAATLACWGGPGSEDLRACLARARDAWHRQRRQLIAWQEELDWQIYEAFGLVESADAVSQPDGQAEIPPEGIELGQRAFEIVLARRRAAGEVQTTWFERHGSTPITEIPAHWPAAYRELVEGRIRRIADDPNIRLIEQPEYKRRWNTEPWDAQLQTAARNWLLARLETYAFDSERMESAQATAAQRASWPAGQSPALFTLAQLVAVAETDAALKEVLEAYTGTAAFDLNRQIKDLLEEASVPYLPTLRYKESGLRKRRDWEKVWDLQRQEDAIEAEIMARLEPEAEKLADSVLAKQPEASPEERQQALERARKRIETELRLEVKERQAQRIGPVPVPPKYASTDFRKPVWWKLRGKLDVPKERWVSYPGLETAAAPSPLYAWAGWNALQQAQALSALYIQRKQSDGWTAAQLTPILAGLQELVPWLQQWHNEFNEDYGLNLGDHFAEFVAEECRDHGLTTDDLDRARWG